ncbi:exonuclease domain-containing protein [Nocardia niwae]|uniref:exonuclease domain-containing protein n=1 Tax=Nocardia niwae TaxID=626084 RepID=UPI0007A5354D|nr:exonuclease domain-containing protein [Nocardia niwae]
MPLAALDFEATSADPFTARIVSACVLRVDGGDVRARNFIADPGVPIPAEASAIHGFTDEYVQKHGRPHCEVVAEVSAEVHAIFAEGRALCIYNASYDASLLAIHDPTFTVGDGLIVDPFCLDKMYDRFRKGSRKLSAVMIHYGMRLDDAHDAEADALAAARLAWKLPRVYPHLATFTASELMTRQADWYREDAYRFIDYLRRNDRPTDGVRTQWPIQRDTKDQAA